MSELLQRARACMPGGVSSPVRAFGAVPGDPPLLARARGAEVFDEQGRAYIDYVGSWGPLILGHSHPAVVEAVTRTAQDGLTFGATCRLEVELAEAILKRYCFADRVRFVSSGTEAVMSAIRLARGVTGRARIVKFEGCYHGHSDGLLVRAGSGLATQGTPSSAGVPDQIAALTDVLELDDEAGVEELFDARGSEIAAVVVEPLPANAGLLVQRPAFLAKLRELTRRYGALLIFDEVISGFRVAPGGMTEISGVVPDLVTLGKIVGGGMPVGAYLGSARWMEELAPGGPVYQAGTLSGNPVAMAAGLATLKELERHGFYSQLEELAGRLERGLAQRLSDAPFPAQVVRVGSILWLALQSGAPPRAWRDVAPAGAEAYARLHSGCLQHGIWLAPSAYEVAFVSAAHSPALIQQTLERFGRALEGIRADSADAASPPIARSPQ